jgi:hypothetical protein
MNRERRHCCGRGGGGQCNGGETGARCTTIHAVLLPCIGLEAPFGVAPSTASPAALVDGSWPLKSSRATLSCSVRIAPLTTRGLSMHPFGEGRFFRVIAGWTGGGSAPVKMVGSGVKRGRSPSESLLEGDGGIFLMQDSFPVVFSPFSSPSESIVARWDSRRASCVYTALHLSRRMTPYISWWVRSPAAPLP